MTADLFKSPLVTALDASGNPYSGAKWYFYETGTSTPAAVYDSADLTSAHSNPVVADSAGRFPPIYFDTATVYRGLLTTSADVPIVNGDVDPVNSAFLQSGTGAIIRSVQDGLLNGTGKTPQQFGAAADGSDDAAALQAWADAGGLLVLPAGSIFASESTISLTQPGTILLGHGGTIETKGAAMDELPLLEVVAADCRIDGASFAHPSYACSQTGERNYGILVKADRCTVTRCRFDGFLHSVAVHWADDGPEEETREVLDWEISFNAALNCIGAGDGPLGDESTYGEDRGDGLVAWGGRGKMLYNVVVPKDGADCRIGVHVEALQDRPDIPGDYDNRYVLIEGNIVLRSPGGTGVFRRGIVTETVSRTLIGGNIIKGFTWWGIAAVQGTAYDDVTLGNVEISDNIVVCDADEADETGAWWSPVRAAYQVAGYGSDEETLDGSIEYVHLADNRAIMESAAAHGFMFQGPANPAAFKRGLSGTGNLALALVDMGDCNAFAAYGCTDVDLSGGNQAIGPWKRGLDAYQTARILFRDNVVDGAEDTRGILVNLAPGEVDLSGTNLGNCGGVEIANSSNLRLHGLKFGSIAGDELTLYNCTQFAIDGMACADGDGLFSIGGTTTHYSIGSNLGFVSSRELGGSLLSDKTSWLNSWGKYEGQEVVAGSPARLYVAEGAADVSPWRDVAANTTITPS